MLAIHRQPEPGPSLTTIDMPPPRCAPDSADIPRLQSWLHARRTRTCMDGELDLAHQIQRALLPASAPEPAGFEMAGWNRSVGYTGGDFYDWQTLPDGRVLVAVGDVTGHGIGPGILAAACRAYMRSSWEIDDCIVRVMARVNRLLRKDLTDGRFVTAALGLLDPTTQCMKLYSAGHGPVLYYRARDRRFIHLDANHVPLGLFELYPRDAAQPHDLAFEPRDALVILTDGFHEWTDATGQEFGLERTSTVLNALADESPQTMIDGLLEAVQTFAGGTAAKDDLTALVVKRSAFAGGANVHFIDPSSARHTAYPA